MSINTEIARLEAAKTALAASITSKGVTVPDGTKLDGMSALVDSIQQGGGENWQITDARYLFYYGARWDIKDKLLPHLTGITNAESMLSYITSGTIDLSEFDFSKVANATRMFGSSTALTSVEGINLQSCTVANYLFQNCKGLTNINTSELFGDKNAVSIGNMCSGCTELKSATLVGKFSTFNWVFYGCSKMTSVDLSGAVASNLSNVDSMFNNCSKLLSVDFSTVDLSNVGATTQTFRNCSALTEIIGFAAPKLLSVSFTGTFPVGTTANPSALKRLVFRQIEGGYAVRASFSIAYDSFDRAGMVEMFYSLPDITPLNLAAAYKKITITGNPCVTDGTLTDTDKAIATDKGWTLVI